MGSIIIRASHVGTSPRTKVAYPGPASDEEMEIAKRAAEYTRSRKSKKNAGTKKKRNSSRTGKNKKDNGSIVLKTAKGSKGNTPSTAKKAIRATPKIIETPLSRQAKNLGITEDELKRKVNAVRNWRSKTI